MNADLALMFGLTGYYQVLCLNSGVVEAVLNDNREERSEACQ